MYSKHKHMSPGHPLLFSDLKVGDSRPARYAGRGKKSCFKTLAIFCVCYEGSILSFKVIKNHTIQLADESSISINTHITNFTKIWLKQAF